MTWEQIRSQIESLRGDLEKVRRDIHQHPELGFEETRTQAIVKAWLEDLGYTPTVSAETGLIADLNPGKGETIALRADLDCLPMQEDTDLPYRSVHDGRAHKCGHDGHTTILMGAAKMLAERRDSIPGNVRLLFQPAEEGVRGGGARVMVKEGALEGVKEVYGLHNWPGWPKGEVRVVPGVIMAQVHAFELTITGKGGHGSQPQLCRDPILAGAQLVSSLQSVVSRGFGYEGGAVLSVCEFHGGTVNNVIPERVRMSGTIRTFSEHATKLVLERMDELVRGTAAAFGVSIETDIEVGFPVLVNDTGCAEVVSRAAEAAVGADKVSARDLPMAGGEDFAYFAKERPSAYFFLGAQKPGEDTPVCHHPDFDFDDELIPLGVEMFLRIVDDRLGIG